MDADRLRSIAQSSHGGVPQNVVCLPEEWERRISEQRSNSTHENVVHGTHPVPISNA